MKPILSPLAALTVIAAVVWPAIAVSPTSIRIDKAATRVGIAKVLLEMHDMQMAGNSMGGNYRIKIPLAPKLNDRGEVLLESDRLDQIMATGGIVEGIGRSRLDGRTHQIRCQFEPSGKVKIRVQTPKRVLSFKTAYHLEAPDDPPSSATR